jgi:hypothetical protein
MLLAQLGQHRRRLLLAQPQTIFDRGVGALPLDGVKRTHQSDGFLLRSRELPIAWVQRRSISAKSSQDIKDVYDDIWLVSFMNYDLGYFDLETRVLEPLENPFGPKCHPCDRYVL